MKRKLNMLENWKKLLAKKEPCKPLSNEKIDRRPDDGSAGGCVVEKLGSSFETTHLAIEAMLKDAELCQHEIKNQYEESIKPQMRAEELSASFSLIGNEVPSIRERFESVGDAISEIKDKLETSLGNCKAILCTQWNRANADMKRLSFSSQESEQTISFDSPTPKAGAVERFLNGAQDVGETTKKRYEKVRQDADNGITHLIQGEKIPAIVDCVKGMMR